MMRYSTPEQVEEEYISSMGQELGSVFHLLVNECSWIHTKWSQFVTLFGTNATRIDLLNAAAGAFFRILQDCLWEDIILHLARLTDPPPKDLKDSRYGTLTLRRLPLLVAADVKAETKSLLNTCLKKCGFVRDWRNRHIAHRNLGLARGDGDVKPLTPASRKNVQDAIESVARLLNAVEMHYRDSEIAYDFTSVGGDAEALLYVLKDGLEAEAQRHIHIRSAATDPEGRLERPQPL